MMVTGRREAAARGPFGTSLTAGDDTRSGAVRALQLVAQRPAGLGLQEVAERNLEEPALALRQDLLAALHGAGEVALLPRRARQPRAQPQLLARRHGTPVAHQEARRHGREGHVLGQDAHRLVQRGRHDPAVHDPRRALMALAEADRRVVGLALHRVPREVQAERVVRPAAEAPGVVLRPHGRGAHRTPPRVWWASTKLAEPAVAIEATAETSRHSAAAATIWASRNAAPSPWHPRTRSQVRA